MNERLLLISYYAVRNDSGEFIGTLEAPQDVTDIKSL